VHGSSIVARLGSLHCRNAACSSSDRAQIGMGRSIEYVVVEGNVSVMSDKLERYEHTSHSTSPVESTFKVERQWGQKGQTMMMDGTDYFLMKKWKDLHLESIIPSKMSGFECS
jgi:hypothetical protein